MKALGFVASVISHILSATLAYHAWVKDNHALQIFVWVLLPFTILGMFNSEFYVKMKEQVKDIIFWVMYIPTFAFNFWCYFIGNHNSHAPLYGSISILLTLIFIIITVDKFKEEN